MGQNAISAPAIVAVSGLPRSGTSMMMGMLYTGGLPVLMDGIRPADINNPLGYFEYAPAKRIELDQQWLGEATGRAVKLISFHLYALPRTYSYKIIFLERPLREVLASQRAMLASKGMPASPGEEEALVCQFEAHLNDVRAWLSRQPNVAVWFVRYHDVLEAPVPMAEATAAFLEKELDTVAMAAVVQPELWRQRI